MNLTIENVPEELVERLRARSHRHLRSLESEVLAVIEDALKPKRLTIEEAYQKVRALGLQTEGDSTEIIRHDRDSRSRR